MTDIALIPASSDLRDGFDMGLVKGDLLRDDSLRTAVVISLFSDREAADSASDDRRGWWGDALAQDSGDRIGSSLWQLQRRAQSAGVLIEAEQAAKAALGWMIDDGIASAVSATASFSGREQLDLLIAIDSPTGRELIRFADVWRNSAATSGSAGVTDAVAGAWQAAAASFPGQS